MSVLSDFSFLDVIFDKDENIKLEEDIKIESDPKDDENVENYWDHSGVDLIDSVLFNQPLDFLPNEDLLSQQKCFSLGNVSGSSASDSGLSSDQQFSPVSFDEIEEDNGDIKPEIALDQSMLNMLCDDTSSDHITLHKSDDDDPIDVCTVKTSKPVVRVKPSISRTNTKVLNISTLQNKPRSILIPVKGKNGVKTIKIIKPSVRIPRRVKTEPVEEVKSSSEETGDEGDQQSKYPRVQLTEEEKRLMIKEGISIPTHYPLTKQEERDLKRIRRKIRNKISAQDSRKRKKEYVDGLEDRVKQCSVENANLMKRVKALQSENQSLSTQLRRLQALVSHGSTQPGTCLMVLVLSLALIMAPNMRNTTRTATNNDLSIPDSKSNLLTGVRTRNVLSTKSEFLEPPLDGDGIVPEHSMTRGASEHDHDYIITHRPQSRKRSRAFIVPPLDETWPPPKAGILTKRNRTTSRVESIEQHILEVEVSSEM
ncbi:CREB-H transcription factor homolog let-607 [Halyomorpha halys]|uniref:CREB-H transcription factor homolog let-607 n=1 Tax=Halyomorpha halys TaxID=286706 RepID=UPI0006D4DD13|nr:uncharacterized protein LOC106680130 [Halyomorpha halys]